MFGLTVSGPVVVKVIVLLLIPEATSRADDV